MKRLTGRTDIGDSLLDEIAFINPDDAEGLYNPCSNGSQSITITVRGRNDNDKTE